MASPGEIGAGAEQAVLGGILIKPELMPEVAIILPPGSFYRGAHNLIYQAMLDLLEVGDPIDLVTVTLLLKERNKLAEVGGAGFLAGLSEEVGYASNTLHYAKIVRDSLRVRQLAAQARDIVTACEKFSGGNGQVDDLYLYAESTLHDATKGAEISTIELVSAPELLARDYSQAVPVIEGGIAPERSNTLVAGESGDGKSMLMLQAGIDISTGTDFCGLGIPKARRTLITQFENSEHTQQIRMRRMLQGLGIECPKNLIFSSPLFRCDLGEKIDRARLTAMIQKSEAEVVIYDPLSSMHRLNENDNSAMRWILDNLREIALRTGTTSLLIHHFGKPGKEEVSGFYRTRGASSIIAWADTVIGFSRKKHDDLVLRTLEFFKVRNGPEPRPITISRDLETFLHHVTDGDTVCSPAKVAFILEGLGGMSERSPLLKAIQAAVGCQERKAREFLDEAVKRQFLRIEGDPTDRRRKNYSLV